MDMRSPANVPESATSPRRATTIKVRVIAAARNYCALVFRSTPRSELSRQFVGAIDLDGEIQEFRAWMRRTDPIEKIVDRFSDPIAIGNVGNVLLEDRLIAVPHNSDNRSHRDTYR